VLSRIDHVALEVPNIDAYIATFTETNGLRLIRRGVATATGRQIAILGDRLGTKIELIENPDCDAIRFLHVAFATDDLADALAASKAAGWTRARGPSEIAAAKAQSAFLPKNRLEIQILQYQPDSPDVATW
jgi:catechol 2,3-dioxygenase-like lactoylglutathione lyase family enzyme